MYTNLKIAMALLFVAAMPFQLHAATQSSETLTAKQVKELEASATTAADHERLAAYYQSQTQQAQKNGEHAEELLKEWGPMVRASKVPDPYPHARRLYWEYSTQVEKFSKLAADHLSKATKYEMAEKAQTTSTESVSATASPKQ